MKKTIWILIIALVAYITFKNENKDES